MKKTITMFSLLVLSGMITQAQDGTTKEKKATDKPAVISDAAPLDAKGVVKYAENGKEEEITTDAKILMVSGNENKLSVKGKVDKLIISGKDNDITISSVNQIVISGSSNFVSWESSENTSGKPVVQDKGGYNNVGKKSGEALNKTDN